MDYNAIDTMRSWCAYRARGYTIVEMLFALAILALLATVVVSGFMSLRSYLALRTAAHDVHTALIDARAATLASKNDTVHGVHIESGKVVRFEGSSYVSGAASNIESAFSYNVSASASLTGGATNIVFNRLTGETAQTGSITLTEPRSGTTVVITIHGSGSVDI